MSVEIIVRKNDTLPYLDFTLVKDSQNTPHNLTDATVTFSMSITPGETPKVNKSAVTIVNATGGTIRYAWLAADTNAIGRYFGEFEVVFSDGKILTFPKDEYIEVTIIEEIA